MFKSVSAVLVAALISTSAFARMPTTEPEVPDEGSGTPTQYQQQSSVGIAGDVNTSAVGGNVAFEAGAITNSVDNNVSNTNDSSANASADVKNSNDTDVQVDARDQSTSTSTTNINETAHSAAPSFSSICTSGAALQRSTYGVSLGVTNDVCTALQMADAYMALGDKDEAKKWVTTAARHAKTKGLVGYVRHIVTLGIL